MASPYQKLINEQRDTENFVKEVTLGRRIGYYTLAQTLGKGAFAEVKLGNHLLMNEKVAVKITEKGKHGCGKTLEIMRQEIGAMEKLDHPNITSLYEEIETLDKFYCILEYVDGGTLQDYVKGKSRSGVCTITEHTARFFFIQILDAVNHMHRCGVYHRDLKTENILMDKDKTIRVADFGISTCERGLITQHCGSPAYCPPEIFKKIPYLAAPMDVWALGCILYELGAGGMPFRARTKQEMTDKILQVDYVIPENFSDNLKDLVQKIIVGDPKDRFTLKEIRGHPWLAGAENSTDFSPDPTLYAGEVRDKLMDVGIPEDLISKAMERVRSKAEPKDPVHGERQEFISRVQRALKDIVRDSSIEHPELHPTEDRII
ncbi:serine/threonine-protein kinase NIM1-like [Bolinopsis microptera]|uniref:serine/threonine-protein kinase NIM1-like n=1 Tax=Bolinopsis microptera TaxID=2820187 RepID=UPI003078B259